jgi:hypothetical protein
MHVTFMHKLCSLLPHIPTYLHVIIMICIDLCGFFINPPYLGYNSAEWETLVLYIFKFQGPFGTQPKLGFFLALLFFIVICLCMVENLISNIMSKYLRLYSVNS